MRSTKAVMFAVIATLLAGDFAQAEVGAGKSATHPTRASVRAHTATAARAQADDVFYAAKLRKSCTYRGGPKSGNWDCR